MDSQDVLKDVVHAPPDPKGKGFSLTKSVWLTLQPAMSNPGWLHYLNFCTRTPSSPDDTGHILGKIALDAARSAAKDLLAQDQEHWVAVGTFPNSNLNPSS